MIWYYKTVTFLPDRCNNEALVSKCLRKLHGFQCEYETREVGVSFPLWSNETVGGKVSFVSTNRMMIDFLLSQSYFQDMIKIGYFAISDTQEVPDYCEQVAFERCCHIDRSTPLGQARYLKRLEKRAEMRGETFYPERYYSSSVIISEHYHSIKDRSSSNGTSFRLNIVKKCASKNKDSGRFSSYGLANSDDSYQTVPLI